MTRIADRATRMAGEANAIVQGRPLMVTVDAHQITVRMKGKRVSFSVPIIAIFELGCRIAANEKRRAKLEARKNRRKL